jgi:hypothetical protein
MDNPTCRVPPKLLCPQLRLLKHFLRVSFNSISVELAYVWLLHQEAGGVQGVLLFEQAYGWLSQQEAAGVQGVLMNMPQLAKDKHSVQGW